MKDFCKNIEDIPGGHSFILDTSVIDNFYEYFECTRCKFKVYHARGYYLHYYHGLLNVSYKDDEFLPDCSLMVMKNALI